MAQKPPARTQLGRPKTSIAQHLTLGRRQPDIPSPFRVVRVLKSATWMID